jgi:hypothetical protein
MLKALQVKRSLIRKFEQLEGEGGFSSSKTSSVGRLHKLGIKFLIYMIRKIHICFSNIHIRVEDKISLANDKTSLGLAAANISLKEDNVIMCQFNGVTLQLSSQVLRKNKLNGKGFVKRIDIDHLCFYWNTNEHHDDFRILSEQYDIDRLRISPLVGTLGYSYGNET